MDRNTFVTERLHSDDRILEIGPLYAPVVHKNDYAQVFYADIRSTEEIKALYSGNEYLQVTGVPVDTGTIVDVDYVLRGSYGETFKDVDKFDAFIASNVIEHVPDIIGFFQDITSVLKPHAKVLIAYPDRRYCFDHFRTDVSFRDAYDVFATGGTDKLARLTMDFFYSAIDENDPRRFWADSEIETLLPDKPFDAAKAHYEECANGQVADDAHYWIFSDRAFVRFIYDCVRAGLFPFTCTDFFATGPNAQEFYAAFQYEPEIALEPAAELANLKRIYIGLQDRLEAELASAMGELTVKTAELTAKTIELTEKTIELTSLKASKSWKLTAPLRRITNWIHERR